MRVLILSKTGKNCSIATESAPKRQYYSILGIPRTATAEEVKIAYRLRAKELHPDKNPKMDTTAAFQTLQEAYSVLGSPERRTLYDAGNVTAATDPNTQATEAEFEPVACSDCGCISAQPRYMQYKQILSFLVISHKTLPSGVFCTACASKRIFWSTFNTAAIGWIGFPWGVFWSIDAIITNCIGGTVCVGASVYPIYR